VRPKAALDVYSQGLRQWLHRQGVQVCFVRLGYVDSRLSYGRTPPALTRVRPIAARRSSGRVTRAEHCLCAPVGGPIVMAVLRAVPESVWKRLPHFLKTADAACRRQPPYIST